MPHILLTNDDGYDAPGLKALAAVLEGWATVSIVAPNGEKSGAAQSLTLRQPIVCHPKGERHWAVDGTPADAVIVALHKLLPEKPDLVISGINHGANMGENIYYSGTVGAARESALHHIPSVAISLCARKDNLYFAHAANIARSAAEYKCAGTVEGRRKVYAAVQKDYAESTFGRERSEGADVLLDF